MATSAAEASGTVPRGALAARGAIGQAGDLHSRADTGRLEVRIGYSADDILYTYLAKSLEFARDYAEVTRPLMMKTLGLTESKGPM